MNLFCGCFIFAVKLQSYKTILLAGRGFVTLPQPIFPTHSTALPSEPTAYPSEAPGNSSTSPRSRQMSGEGKKKESSASVPARLRSPSLIVSDAPVRLSGPSAFATSPAPRSRIANDVSAVPKSKCRDLIAFSETHRAVEVSFREGG